MPHVVFVHGLSNKPESAYLHELWKRKLAHEDGLDLDSSGIDSSLVYWADVLYGSPDTDLAAYEAAANDLNGLERAWNASIDVERLSAVEVDRLQRLLQRCEITLDDLDVPALDAAVASDARRERIPLPPAIRKRAMAELVRDAHHYFYNLTFSPRTGVSYRVRDELRSRFVGALKAAAAKPGPLVVVSHSMGTILAYDCLRHVDDCPSIDGLITAGSPLGLDEVQDFFPAHAPADAFPRKKLRGAWINVYDPFDVVAMLDPRIANDFQENGKPVVRDVSVSNDGMWRDSISKYLRQATLRDELREMLARR